MARISEEGEVRPESASVLLGGICLWVGGGSVEARRLLLSSRCEEILGLARRDGADMKVQSPPAQALGSLRPRSLGPTSSSLHSLTSVQRRKENSIPQGTCANSFLTQLFTGKALVVETL